MPTSELPARREKTRAVSGGPRERRWCDPEEFEEAGGSSGVCSSCATNLSLSLSPSAIDSLQPRTASVKYETPACQAAINRE